MRSLLVVAALAALSVSAFATDLKSVRHEIREDLLRRPYLGAGWVHVRGDGPVVVLEGRVPDALHRAVVVAATRNVPGVKLVRDALTLDAKLVPWQPAPAESSRIRLANARKLLRGDEVLGPFTTLHVGRDRRGLVVTGDVSSDSERVRIERLLLVDRSASMRVLNDATVRPDASRRSPLHKADEATRLWADSVTDAIRTEPLLRGLVSVTASVERRALVLRGTATRLVAHDLALEIARAKLIERRREAARVRAGSGELTKLLAGDPGSVEGEVPEVVESLVIVAQGR